MEHTTKEKYENDGTNENALPDLYRQMDPKDLIFTETEASPARRIEAPPGKCFSANAHENPSQS
jgi:hypothetical protein